MQAYRLPADEPSALPAYACLKNTLPPIRPTTFLNHMKPLTFTLSLLLTAALIWFCAGIGFGEWQMPHQMDETVQAIRLPRVFTALLVGAALAAAGAALQALFDNPLAAFVGALAVCLLILTAHKLFGGGTLGLLVLGFVLSAFSAALVSLILLLSDDLVLRSATTWLSGSLAEAGFTSPLYAAGVMLAGLLLLVAVGKKLDILMLGDETAVSMGISVQRVRVQTVVGAALLTGAAVSMSGIIGFLGMMVPNVMAQTAGGRRSKLIILSAWFGALFLLAVDSAARWFTYPVDVPAGIVIALLGGPFFIWLFLRPLRGH